MDKILNWDLISNPANWLIVFLVLYMVALMAHIIAASAGGAPILFPNISIGGGAKTS